MSQILDAVDERSAPVEIPEDVNGAKVESSAIDYRQNEPGYGEFEYTPMPVLAPISAILGVCSLIAFLGLFGIILSVAGIVIGALACLKILRSKGTLTGMKPALAGLVLSAFSAVGGSSLLAYTYKHEVPEGYQRVSFAQEISENAFLVEDGKQDIHPDVKALVDQPIFLKGFMYPTGKTEGLQKFLLLKDSGQCCFGGQPALQDMVEIRMKEGSEVDFYAGRVSVAGKFKINSAFQGADPLEPLFLLEGEYFTKSKTSF